MNKFEYKNLTPFKWFVLENFPFLEADYDALTEWQLFCKLGKEINKIIDSQNTVGSEMEKFSQAFIDLQNYVNNYFNNLDVQDEINNKLNSMANDGSLSQIINENLFKNINQSILQNSINISANKNNIENKISKNEPNSITTNMLTQEVRDAMTGGSVPVVGIDSVGFENIRDNSISIIHFDEMLKSNFSSDFSDYLDLGESNKGFYNIHGNLVQADDYVYYRYPLTKGKIYNYQGINIFEVAGLVIKDIDNNVIFKSSDKYVPTKTGDAHTFKVNKDNLVAYITKMLNDVNKVNVLNINSSKLRVLDNIYNNLKYNFNVTPLVTKNSYYIPSNERQIGKLMVTLIHYESSTLKIYPMNKGIHYKIKGYNYFDIGGLIITDNTNVVIYSSSYQYVDKMTEFEYDFLAEEDGFIYAIDVDANHLTEVKKILPSLVIDTNNFLPNKLNGKTILFAGDSITYGADRPQKEDYSQRGWVKRIQDYNPLALVHGFGQGGATIAKLADSNNNVLAKLPNMHQLYPHADYIIIQGGVNDAYNNVPLGEITNNYTSEYDVTTFSGALEYIFDYCTKNWQGKNIGFIVTHKVPSAGSLPNERFYNMMMRSMEICKKWSIPYIDLFDKSNLNFFIDDIKNNFSAKQDGLHPNALGYDVISPKINQWLITDF